MIEKMVYRLLFWATAWGALWHFWGFGWACAGVVLLMAMAQLAEMRAESPAPTETTGPEAVETITPERTGAIGYTSPETN